MLGNVKKNENNFLKRQRLRSKTKKNNRLDLNQLNLKENELNEEEEQPAKLDFEVSKEPMVYEELPVKKRRGRKPKVKNLGCFDEKGDKSKETNNISFNNEIKLEIDIAMPNLEKISLKRGRKSKKGRKRKQNKENKENKEECIDKIFDYDNFLEQMSELEKKTSNISLNSQPKLLPVTHPKCIENEEEKPLTSEKLKKLGKKVVMPNKVNKNKTEKPSKRLNKINGIKAIKVIGQADSSIDRMKTVKKSKNKKYIIDSHMELLNNISRSKSKTKDFQFEDLHFDPVNIIIEKVKFQLIYQG